MFISVGKSIPQDLCYTYVILVGLFLLRNCDVHPAVLIVCYTLRNMIEGCIRGGEFVVDFTWVLFAYFFVFLGVVFCQIMIADIILPLLQPFCAQQIAIWELLLLEDFSFVYE